MKVKNVSTKRWAVALAAAFLFAMPLKAFALIDPFSIGTALGYSLISHAGVAGTIAYFTKPSTTPSTVRADGTLVTPSAVVYVDLVNGVPTAVEKAVNIETSFSNFKSLASAVGVDQTITDSFFSNLPESKYGQDCQNSPSCYSGLINDFPNSIGKVLKVSDGYKKISATSSTVLGAYSSWKDYFSYGYPGVWVIYMSDNKEPTCTNLKFYLTPGFTAADLTPATPAGLVAKTPSQVKTAFETNAGAMTAVQAMFSKTVAENGSVPHTITDPATGNTPVQIPTTALTPEKQTQITTAITGATDVATKKAAYDAVLARFNAVPPTATQDELTAAYNAWIAAIALSDANNSAVKPPTTTNPVVGPVTVPGTGTAYSAGAESGSFGTRFQSFMSDMKSKGLFSLPAQFLGTVPGGGSPIFNVSFGSLGSTVFDLSSLSAAIAVIRMLCLFAFSFAGFKIITLKGG